MAEPLQLLTIEAVMIIDQLMRIDQLLTAADLLQVKSGVDRSRQQRQVVEGIGNHLASSVLSMPAEFLYPSKWEACCSPLVKTLLVVLEQQLSPERTRQAQDVG